MRGFTLIEILVTLIITMLIFVGTVAGYSRFTDLAKMKQVAATLKNDMRVAQNDALSGIKPLNVSCGSLDGYVFSFTANSYSYQAQCDGAPAGRETKVVLPTPVTFSPIPSAVLFDVLTHGVNVNADTTITLTNGNRNYALKLTPLGDIVDLGFQ